MSDNFDPEPLWNERMNVEYAAGRMFRLIREGRLMARSDQFAADWPSYFPYPPSTTDGSRVSSSKS